MQITTGMMPPKFGAQDALTFELTLAASPTLPANIATV